MNSVGLAREYE